MSRVIRFPGPDSRLREALVSVREELRDGVLGISEGR